MVRYNVMGENKECSSDCYIKRLYQKVKDLEDENKKLLLLVNKKGLN